MSKILFKNINNINQNSGTKQKIINIRKPINKIMNIDNFINKNNLSRSPRIDSKISLYSFQKSYVSPTVSSLQCHNSNKFYSKKVSPQKSKPSIIKPTFIYFNNRNKSPKQGNSYISPVKQSNNFLNQNIKKKLYNQRNVDVKLSKNKTTDKTGSKKYSFNIKKKKNELNVNIKKKINNYKNKIIINKEKLKNMNSKMILNSLTDIDNSCSFRNNSNEANDKVRQAKKSNNIFSDISNQERNNKEEFNNLFLSSNDSAKRDNNTNAVNNLFEVGSISNISKNGSGSAKGKNLEDVCKSNNNAFENIINEFVEEGKCNNLFNEKTDNIKGNENKNNNKESKSDAHNDNLTKENDINKKMINEEKKNNNEIINENINSNKCFEENEDLENLRINNENKENSIENIIINKNVDKNIKIEDEKEKEENEVNHIIDNVEVDENSKKELKDKEIKDENLEHFEKESENEVKEIKANEKEENEYDNNVGNENDVNDINIINKNENKNEVLVMKENEENKNTENIENEVEEKENNDIINKSNDNHLKDNIILSIREIEEKKEDKNNIELIPDVNNKEISNDHEKKEEQNNDEIKANTNEDIGFQNDNSNNNKEYYSQENYPNENINLNIINGLPKNKGQNKNKINKINNLIRSVEIPIISKKIEHIPVDKNDLHQSQKTPNIHIMLTKLNIYPDLDIDFNHNSVRRLYQRRRFKSVSIENLQIFFDNSFEEKKANSYTNRSYENLYKKAKLLSDSKKKKSIPLNLKSKQINISIIKFKLKNIILKEPIKRCNSIKTLKYSFKKWKKMILFKEKDNNIIINTAVYKADPNQENEKMYKLPSDINNAKEEHYGYYDSNIAICHPIKITIKNGIFFIINDNKVDESHFNVYKDKEEDMEIFVIKDVKNRNFSFQKNDNYTFGGIY